VTDIYAPIKLSHILYIETYAAVYEIDFCSKPNGP